MKVRQRSFQIVMGPGQNFLTWIGSAIYGLGLDLENFPLKSQKEPGSKAGRPLIYCGSKVSSGRVGLQTIVILTGVA